VTQDEEKTFQMPEVMPEFPGGMEALYAYLGKNLNYPKAAKENQFKAM
jgi:protein TonB